MKVKDININIFSDIITNNSSDNSYISSFGVVQEKYNCVSVIVKINCSGSNDEFMQNREGY